MLGLPAAQSGGGGEVGGGGGNRWPRQETLALLKIRSDMDTTFRDASLKGPLWEEVSKKMGELGFERSAKKCKEKFENVFKYHKRTKDGRASKSDGKSYRFFDQLEALENTSPNHFTPPPPSSAAAAAAANPTTISHVTVPSESPIPLSVVPPKMVTINPINSFQQSYSQLPPPPQHPLSNSTSSSTSSDEDVRLRGRKRRWKDYLQNLMREIVEKQEDLQKKFLDTLEQRERDRIARDEAWRVQELARIKQEHDLLVQERSIAAAKHTAVIAFLQKFTGETNLQIPPPPENPPPPPPQPPQSTLPPPPKTMEIRDNGVENDQISPASSSRWPKPEIEALIRLRTNLELKYQENGPKGPLWEEISKAMSNLGYNRSSKRCKEKWENINKYFKKVKEGSKKRSEDSKTCPYFNQLEAIYKEKAKNHISPPMMPIMAQPEQQWPQQQQQIVRDNESETHEDEDEDDDEVDEYEMIATKEPSSVVNAEREREMREREEEMLKMVEASGMGAQCRRCQRR